MGGTSSKAQFVEIVRSLLEQDVDSSEHSFWDELWKTTLTAEEMFDIISADDMRRLITQKPQNCKTIFTQAVAQLYQVVETPYPIYFDQALNCIKMLSRMTPLLLEVAEKKYVRELLWSRKYNSAVNNGGNSSGGSQNRNSKEFRNSNSTEAVRFDGAGDSEPLAVILVNTLFHLLFLPEFTIEDPNTEFTENDINRQEFKNALMWYPGVGSTNKPFTNFTTHYDTNRQEVLRLMIAVFSDSLFQNADTYDSCLSLWLEVATSADAPYAEIVFYSLINTVLGYDPIGWGVPYGNIVSTDTAKGVVEMAVQVLVILLDYGLPIRKRGEEGAPLPCVSADDIEAKGFNIFRKVLSKIDSPDHLTFMYKGFVRLLNNVHQAENSYLPYSVTRVSIEQELLILLWKCLEEIPRFMTYILKHCDINEIVVPICYFMLEGRKDPAKVGLMYLCTFTLLKLSGERNFGVALNKPYAVSLPVDVPLFTGNHADLLVIVLHKLIVSGLDRLSALYNCFLTIICNVSPYCKSLCNVSAVKLVNLFQLFVSPRFLYASESNHTYVVLLLETFNNIVQYQYEGNSDVVYAIIRRKEAFETLANLNLPVAIKIAKDIAEKKDSKSISVADNNGTTAKSNTKSNSNSSTLSKKYSGSREEDVIDNVTAEGAPTDLISTQSVERRVNTAGEISDVRTNSAAGEGDNRLSARNADGTMKFVPTAAWLQAVKAELPLHTIMRLLKHLVPQLEELASVGADGIATADEAQLVSYISKTTMVGLLPVPHPIVIRKYQPNKYTSLWFTAFQWGVIFMHNQTVPLFDGKKVKLFMVQTVQ